jgi:hypothetical protein
MLETTLQKALEHLNANGWNVYQVSPEDQSQFVDPILRGPVTQFGDGTYLVLPRVADPKSPSAIRSAHEYMSSIEMWPISPADVGAVPLMYFDIKGGKVIAHAQIDISLTYQQFEHLTTKIQKFVWKTPEELLRPRVETYQLENTTFPFRGSGNLTGTLVNGTYTNNGRAPEIAQVYSGLPITILRQEHLLEDNFGIHDVKLVRFGDTIYTVDINMEYNNPLGSLVQVSVIGLGEAERVNRLFNCISGRLTSLTTLTPIDLAHRVPNHLMEQEVNNHAIRMGEYISKLC